MFNLSFLMTFKRWTHSTIYLIVILGASGSERGFAGANIRRSAEPVLNSVDSALFWRTVVWPRQVLRRGSVCRMCYTDTAKHFVLTSALDEEINFFFSFMMRSRSTEAAACCCGVTAVLDGV